MNNHFDMNHEPGSHPRGRGRRGHGPGPGRGRGMGPGREHRGGPRRRNRGDVRTAVLTLLAEEPMHGYQLMQTIGERTNGAWSPSPGAIYPTLSQLEDEGLVAFTADGDRKLASLTDAGRAYVAEHSQHWPDPFPQGEGDGVNLRELLGQLADATRTVGRSGTEEQRAKVAEILTTARKDIYLLLAEQ